MGAFDDLEGRSSGRYSSMLGRGMGEARRRMVLLIFLAFFLLLTVVAFRRQDTIKEVVNSRLHPTNTTATIAKPATAIDSKPELQEAQPSTKPDLKAGTTATGSKQDSKGDTKSDTKSTKPSKSKTASGFKSPKLGNGDRTLEDSSMAAIHNSSLGFEKIYVINVPSRSDKLDAMKVTASLTEFDFDIIEGISGADVPKKALSGPWKEGPRLSGQIGCWRGHMEFAGHVARNRLSTALVMEDDADWDVALRSQLEYVALGSRVLQNTPKDKEPHSPYGDDWDLIWLGHCASQPVDGDDRRFLMKNDPTVTPVTHRTNYGTIPDMSPYDNTTRIMYWSKGSTCTYSYALSLHGARKILKWLSMDIYSGPVDFGLHDMCEKKERGFKCIGVFPQIIADHKPAGGGYKDTDIGDETENIRQHGFSYNIVKSTRLNVDALTDGDIDKVTSQWPSEDPHLTGPIETEYITEPPQSGGGQH